MSTDQRIRSRRLFRHPMLIIGGAMVIFYLCFGIFIFLRKDVFADFPAEFLHIFATLLIVYGVYRGWRLYEEYFKSKE